MYNVNCCIFDHNVHCTKIKRVRKYCSSYNNHNYFYFLNMSKFSITKNYLHECID